MIISNSYDSYVLEKNENIKLDYVSFQNKNNTRSIHSILSDEIDEVSGIQIQNFFDVAIRQKQLKLFEIKRPHYGVLRGEVVSVLKCLMFQLGPPGLFVWHFHLEISAQNMWLHVPT